MFIYVYNVYMHVFFMHFKLLLCSIGYKFKTCFSIEIFTSIGKETIQQVFE